MKHVIEIMTNLLANHLDELREMGCDNLRAAQHELGLIDSDIKFDIKIEAQHVQKINCYPNLKLEAKFEKGSLMLNITDINHSEFYVNIDIPNVELARILRNETDSIRP